MASIYHNQFGLTHLISSLLFIEDDLQQQELESPSKREGESCYIECSKSLEDEHCLNKISVIIPPDLVSASTADCTTNGGDDDACSSVSSLSYCSSVENRRRSLFPPKQWNNHTTATASSSRQRAYHREKFILSDSDLYDDDRSGNMSYYERPLKHQELSISKANNNLNDCVRSSIFSNDVHASSHLSIYGSAPLSRRSAVSDSALIVKPSKSILRTPRYSMCRSNTASPEKKQATLRFCQTVKIIAYEIPQEQWAGMGWSTYFH